MLRFKLSNSTSLFSFSKVLVHFYSAVYHCVFHFFTKRLSWGKRDLELDINGGGQLIHPFRKHTETPTGGRTWVPRPSTDTQTCLLNHSSQAQQEPRFEVCHIREGPRLEIKQTPPPPLLSLHLDSLAAELQLAELHTRNLPGETLQRDCTVYRRCLTFHKMIK